MNAPLSANAYSARRGLVLEDEPDAAARINNVVGNQAAQVGDNNIQINNYARSDAGLVGRWECVRAAGGISESDERCDISGSYVVQFGVDGRGKHIYDQWRRSHKDALDSPLREVLGHRWVVLLDGTREFSYTAYDGAYAEAPDPFPGTVRCTYGGIQDKSWEETWRAGKATEARYLVNGDRLTLYTGASQADYRRCAPG
jgi:hypothetical protein